MKAKKIKSSNKKKLKMKVKGVQYCLKHIQKKIKKEQLKLRLERSNCKSFSYNSDRINEKLIISRESRIQVLNEEKISLEKYEKKLKYMISSL